MATKRAINGENGVLSNFMGENDVLDNFIVV